MEQAEKPIYARVSSKGQLVIPSAIREKLGITPGTRVAIRLEGPELVLKPETLAAKLAMIDKMRGITKTLKRIDGGGELSMCDELLEDRRRERERELREEGW
jgi:AbrB family looped-hinge helix DNA binding protein